MLQTFIQIFFIRPPIPKEVKTRLAVFLGATQACRLYDKMLYSLFDSFQSQKDIQMILFSTEVESHIQPSPYILAAGGKEIYIQEGENLGERLANAFFRIAVQTTQDIPILIAGTDHPCYRPSIAREASRKLLEYDAVLGPTYDGGYYLVGLRASLAKNKELVMKMFGGMTWSHDSVYSCQIQRFQQYGIHYTACTETLEDIDVFSDLILYQKNRKKRILQKDSKTKIFIGPSFEEFIPKIRVILPVLNEAENLPPILKKLSGTGYFQEIICADNGSTDGSVETAQRMGATVTYCQRKGYGATCLTALDYIRKSGGCDVVLFADADGSDDLSFLDDILTPTVSDQFDFCLGRRSSQLSQSNALLPHARFGNWLAAVLMAWCWSFTYHDLGPFRSIRWLKLEAFQMDDQDFGWTIQMQIRAAKQNCRILEVPVAYRKRVAGKSKVSANLRGSIKAGAIILGQIFREWRREA